MTEFMTASMDMPEDKEPLLFSSFDEIFDHYIDSDSYGQSDNTADRSTSDEWENYHFFDVADTASDCGATAHSPRMAHTAFSLRGSWASEPDGLEELLLQQLESRSRSASPFASLQLTPIRNHAKSSSLDAPRSRSAGFGKNLSSRTLTMSHSPGSHQGHPDSWSPPKVESTARAFPASAHDQSPCFSGQPASTPLPQGAWKSEYYPYGHQESFGQGSGSQYAPLPPVDGGMHLQAHGSPAPTSYQGMGRYGAAAGATYRAAEQTPAASFDAAYEPAAWSYPESGAGYACFGAMVSPQPYSSTVASADQQRRDSAAPLYPGYPHRQGLPPTFTPTGEIGSASPTTSSDQAASHTDSITRNGRLGRSTPGDAAHPQPHQRTPQPDSHDTPGQHFSAHHALPERSASPPAHQSPPRSRKGSRGPSTQHRRSKTLSGTVERGRGVVPTSKALDFKNYTPADRKDILNGVAPSGSSKTKARREKEAAERAQRMREEAAKAILEAGGDVASLRRAFPDS